jgi:hypothetical protein
MPSILADYIKITLVRLYFPYQRDLLMSNLLYATSPSANRLNLRTTIFSPKRALCSLT